MGGQSEGRGEVGREEVNEGGWVRVKGEGHTEGC